MKPTPHITFLDHVRGIAILWVFLLHCVGAGYWKSYGIDELPWNGLWRSFHVPPSVFVLFPATLGKVGVAIFFVVSGFCIHLSHQRSREKGYVTFFIRRFFRLYPAYLVAVLIYAFAVSDTALDFVNARWISLGDLGSHLLMVHNLVNRYCFSMNGALWSIGVEVQLYAIYPLLLVLTARLGWLRALWLAAGIEFGMRTLQGVMLVVHPGSDLPNWYNQFPLLYWYSWSIGAALAEAFLKGEPLPFRKLSPWLCPALFFVCFFFRPLYPFCFPLGALATARILSGLLARPSVVLPTKGWKGFFWENLRWAGLVSYSAYLLHGLVRVEVPDLLQRFFPTREFHPFFVSAICICTWFLCLGMSSLSFALIEQPGIALGKRLIKRISAMTAAPAAPAPKLVEGA